MLDTLFKHAPDIIREARKSVLGVVSLILLVLGAVAAVLFKDEADATAKIIILSLLMLSSILLVLVLVWAGYRAASHQVEVERSPKGSSGASRRALGVLILAGIGLLLIVVWTGFQSLFYEETRRHMTDPNSSYISGWTTIFEENGVLRGRGGTLTLYPEEIVQGYMVYVHVPRERIVKSEWVKDGGGNDMLAVTVTPP